MRTFLFGAIRVDMQRMIANGKTQFSGDFFLACFDGRIVELLDMAALQANDVVVMFALVQLEYRLATLEMVTHQQTGLLKTG